MADELPRPPPAPRFLTPAVALPRIQAIVSNASTIWFSQIGYLAFITVTLLSVRDLDFFSATARISLPLLGVTIPTETFFYIAPWLAAVLHVYFHLFLLKLWDAVAEAPASVGSLPLAERVAPWLVVDWAIRRRPDYRRATTQRPMNLLGSAVTGFLIWLATPILIAVFWWRSMPAHDARLTLAIGVALLVSLFASLGCWRRARRTLQLPGVDHDRRSWRRPGFLPGVDRAARGIGILALWLLMLGAVPLVALGGLMGAGMHHMPQGFGSYFAMRGSSDLPQPPLAVADLVDAQIAQRPADWRDWDVAKSRFHITWCRDQGLPAQACDTPEHPDQHKARREWCAAAGLTDQVDCDRRFARIDAAFAEEWRRERQAHRATITRPDLARRDLRGAITRDAFLVGIDLRQARLEGADLRAARLEGADLREARFDGADLRAARLEGADLREAQLEGADLREAQLDGADLRKARLKRADLRDVQLEGLNLSWARFEEANLGGARFDTVNLSWARFDGANLRQARFQRANLFGARLQGANLFGVRIEGANLGGAGLEGTNLWDAKLPSAEWAGATIGASPAHSADFSGGRNLTQRQLAQVIGDGNTILPLDAETGQQLYVWTCWAEPPMTLDGLLRHWPEPRHAALRAKWLCGERKREHTGRPDTPQPAAPSAD